MINCAKPELGKLLHLYSISDLKIFPVFLTIFILLLAGENTRVGAYTLEGVSWPQGTHVVMQLGLGASPVALQDGFPNFNASAADAAAIWNGYLDFIHFTTVSSGTVPEASGDGVNSVFFSNTLFGDSFGEDTLAATVYLRLNNPGAAEAEADVVVNNAYHFDSYRGVLQNGVYDIHRVLLHEFGHVLGLDHVTDNPVGQAIMEPVISDLDHLGADDRLGIRRSYGASLENTGEPIAVRVGDSVGVIDLHQFQANNYPISYSVIGLPTGVTYNAAVGQIAGSPTVAGAFDPVIIAHGPNADAYGSFPLTVYGLDRVQGLKAIIPTAGYKMVADPIRPRIYTASDEGLKMIDTDSFVVTKILGGDLQNANLSISADGSMLLYTIGTTPAQVPGPLYRIDLSTLRALPILMIPTNQTAVLEGAANQDYVSGPSGVYQFDRATGALQAVVFSTGFSNGYGIGPAIAISPDRTSLYVTDDGNQLLYTYDVSGSTPVLLHSLSGQYFQPTPSPDGKYLYYRSDSSTPTQLFQGLAPDLTPSVAFAASSDLSQIAVGPDGSIYFVGPPSFGGTFSLYDPTSLKQTCTIDLNRFDLAPIPDSFFAGPAAFDSSGKNIFVSVGSLTSETWVFPADVASLPSPPPDPTQDLLNISTRAYVGTGNDVMIAGFIVQGPKPKKLLIRGLGPSLPITGAMGDPVLTLFDSTGKQIATNDNWVTNRDNIIGTQLPPPSSRESAIVTTLAPGSYTAIVHDQRNQPGLALIETYDLDPGDSTLANISTRGTVRSGDDVMIAGFIIGGKNPTNVLVRALGPSLSKDAVTAPLKDPILEIHDAAGKLIMSNDNWRSTQAAKISATGLAPSNGLESAIVTALAPGSYTAIVRGQNSSTGVALVEVYNLDATPAK